MICPSLDGLPVTGLTIPYYTDFLNFADLGSWIFTTTTNCRSFTRACALSAQSSVTQSVKSIAPSFGDLTTFENFL
jgi:hypothetical protein